MELLTVQETAKLLKVHPITVRRYIATGTLPAVKVGRGVRIHKEAVEQLVVPAAPDDFHRDSLPQAGQALTYDDPLWELIGSATDAGPTDAAKKHEYLAESVLLPRP